MYSMYCGKLIQIMNLKHGSNDSPRDASKSCCSTYGVVLKKMQGTRIQNYKACPSF
jgi:hypothetical protein